VVRLYTDRKYVNGDVITDNEAYFDSYISAKSIDEVGRKYLERIDGVAIKDDKTGLIVTPLGAALLENISTGTKTVLNLLHMQRSNEQISIDITECGANALDVVFELMENYNGAVNVVLGHADTSECGDREYCVNDAHVVHGGVALSIKLMELLEVQNGSV
jgi:hypothetical protein